MVSVSKLSNIEIIWMPIFEWYVGRYGSDKRHQKHMNLKEIRLHAQNMLILLDSIVDIIREWGTILNEQDILQLDYR